MGLGLSAYAVYQLARSSALIVGRAARDELPRAYVDAQLRTIGARIVERARIRLDVRGADALPRDRAFVYMSNHQSHVDIPVFLHTVPSPTVRMVAKAELFRVPLWGRAMRAAGMIEVDRGKRARAIESLERATDELRSGVSVWIAPEGTRSLTGKLGPLKKGGFYLARATNTAIVPVALSGTRRVLPSKALVMTPGVSVRVVYGAPIEVVDRSLDSLMDEVAAFLSAHVEL